MEFVKILNSLLKGKNTVQFVLRNCAYKGKIAFNRPTNVLNPFRHTGRDNYLIIKQQLELAEK